MRFLGYLHELALIIDALGTIGRKFGIQSQTREVHRTLRLLSGSNSNASFKRRAGKRRRTLDDVRRFERSRRIEIRDDDKRYFGMFQDRLDAVPLSIAAHY